MRSTKGISHVTILLILIIVLLSVLVFRAFRPLPGLSFETPYQAVLLSNGQVFFGKLENTASQYPVLTDIYYVQSQVDQEKKQTKNILVKRGKEWHARDRMILNATQIVFIEPV